MKRLLLASFFVLASCGSSAGTSDEGEVRIITMSAGITESVFALGLGDQVVGKDLSSTLAAADGLPIVTSGHDVSAEAVLALQCTVTPPCWHARSGNEEAEKPEATQLIKGPWEIASSMLSKCVDTTAAPASFRRGRGACEP